MATPIASVVPSRTSGVAPLAVFFDATGTTGDVTNAFRDLFYMWNFGDSDAGTWSAGSNTSFSKNFATNAVAAHVYDTPGTYTWTMLVWDGTNVDTETGTITVSDPDTVYAGTNTICVSTSGNFTGAPAGCVQVTDSDFDVNLDTYIGTTKRVLFRRGETFVSSASVSIADNGPWTIGAFGSGSAKAIVDCTQSAGNIITLAGAAGVYPNDGRIMELDMSQSTGTTTSSIKATGNFDQLLVYKNYIHDIGDGFFLSVDNINVVGNTRVWDQIFVVDNTIENINGGAGTHGVYAFATQFALMGNVIDDTVDSEHLVRLDYLLKAVVAHNTLTNSASAKETIAIRGAQQDSGGASYLQYVLATPCPTRYVVVTDNNIEVLNAAEGIKVGPANGTIVNSLLDIITERNYYYGPAGSVGQGAVYTKATRHTSRNEVVNANNWLYFTALIATEATTGSPAASYVFGKNITMYSDGDSGNGTAYIAYAEAGVTNSTLINSLAYVPNATSTTSAILDGSGGGLTGSNNVSDADIKNTNPFVSTPTTMPASFVVSISSYAANGGTASFPAQQSDFFNAFDKSDDNRIGAVVQDGEQQIKGVAA